jgi:hypothetical protein
MFFGESCAVILTKNGLGYILGDFFANSSGHPAFCSNKKWEEKGFEGNQLESSSFVELADLNINFLLQRHLLAKLRRTLNQVGR